MTIASDSGVIFNVSFLTDDEGVDENTISWTGTDEVKRLPDDVWDFIVTQVVAKDGSVDGTTYGVAE
jgi:hypothetical protein